LTAAANLACFVSLARHRAVRKLILFEAGLLAFWPILPAWPGICLSLVLIYCSQQTIIRLDFRFMAVEILLGA